MDELEAGKLTECCELLNTIANQEDNKKCFDCTDNDSPRYLCSTFLTFVCSCCASIHQEFGHKIKVLSVFGFTVNEICVLKGTGNRVAADKWLARWDPAFFNEPDPTSPTYKEDARNYMRAKYVEKKWVKLPPRLPIGKIQGSPCRSEEPSPREVGSLDASPRGNDVSPRGYVDLSPRYYASESPTKVGADVSPRGHSIDQDAFKQQQHDIEKPPFNPFLRDPYPTTPPVVYSYVSQPMLLPMSFPPGQYGYPQYPVALDLNSFPQPYYSCPTPFQQPLYTFPYDPHSQMTTVSSDNVSSWADTKPRERVLQQSCKELPRVPIDDMPHHVPVLRSASDNSLATTMRQVVADMAATNVSGNNECSKCSTPATPGSAEKTVTKTELHKQKFQGLVSKVTGLLKKSQN